MAEQNDELAAIHWRINKLEERLAVVETPADEPTKARSFFKVEDWKDGVKLVGLPLAFFLACYTFYDDIYLRFLNRDTATVDAVQSKIAELQSLNAEMYLLNVAGKSEDVSAIMEAKSGRRQRLIGETYEYWTSRPDYFTPSEKQILANELLMQSKTDLALSVADDYGDEVSTRIEKADLALFRGRILSNEGPAFDLEAARAEFQKSIDISADLARSVQRREMWAKTLAYWLYIEDYYETECATVRPVASRLAGLMDDGDASVDLGIMDAQARSLLATHDQKCGP